MTIIGEPLIIGSTGGGGGSAKNVQCCQTYESVAVTTYTGTDVTLTVAKTGTYKVSWMGTRNTTGGTSGSRLYVNGTAYGSAAITTFLTDDNNYCQYVELDNVSLSANDVLVVKARARSTSYKMTVGNLCIVEK